MTGMGLGKKMGQDSHHVPNHVVHHPKHVHEAARLEQRDENNQEAGLHPEEPTGHMATCPFSTVHSQDGPLSRSDWPLGGTHAGLIQLASRMEI